MARPQIPVNSWGAITIKKNKSGTWTARGTFRDFTGDKHNWTASAKTRVMADAALRAKADNFLPSNAGAYSPSMTVEELFKAWIDDKRTTDNLNDLTADDYEQVWRLHLRDRFGKLTVREVTTGNIQEFLNTLTQSNARRGRVILTGMFGLAERMDIVKRNPANATKVRKVDAKKIRALTHEEIDRVREYLYTWDAKRPGPKSFRISDFFDIMIGTGLRPGELLSLQWSDVNFHDIDGKVTISVNGTLRYRDGKQRGRLTKSDAPKTDASIRVVPVPEWVAAILRRLHSEREITPSNAVLVTRSGNFVSPNNVARSLRRVREDLDMMWMTPHSFRKTAATHITQTLGEEKAASVLGHSDPSVTRKYYIDRRQITADASEAMEKFAPSPQVAHLRAV